MSVKHLCRTICPKTSNSASIPVAGIINPSTTLIGFDPVQNQYDKAGWKPANNVPVIMESCSSWHYEQGSDVKGPASCRHLASLYHDLNGTAFNNDTRVWSPELASAGVATEWKKICELPNLIDAMEALKDDVPMDFNSLVKQHETSTKKNAVSKKGQEENDLNNEENDLLRDFLSSAAGDGDCEEEEEIDEEYESDGGTIYVKDVRSGEWVNSKLVQMMTADVKSSKKRKLAKKDGDRTSKESSIKLQADLIKKKKKPKFKSRNAKCWVYATGFPSDTSEEEVALFFSKVGILDIDPESQKPKVKLYRYNKGDGARAGLIKGDVSVCFARAESVELALQLLDDTIFRTVDSQGKIIGNSDVNSISVQRAKFEQHGVEYRGKRAVSDAKRKVARLAKLQAVGWDDGENGRITGGLKGLCIIVLKHMFNAREVAQLEEESGDIIMKEVETKVWEECEKLGHVEKITIFAKNPSGVVIVKFTQPTAASRAVEMYKGIKGPIEGKKIDATFWDGVTDFTVHDEIGEKKETEKRLDEFGKWLDGQEIPDEFKLQVQES